MPHLLKRLRGDAYLRQQLTPLRESLRSVQRDLEQIAHQAAAAADAKSADAAKEAQQAPTQPSGLVDTRDRPYLASILESYEGWVAEWLSAERPWYTGGATRWLEAHLGNDDRVFEYGAGRSTVWWCQLAGAVETLEASPEWIAYLNFYLGDRPELMAKLQMIHVPADWNPNYDGGVKQYWKHRKSHLTTAAVDSLERRYLQVQPNSPNVLAFDGSIRTLTMAKWALDGAAPQSAEVVVVDNTETGLISSLAEAIAPQFVRLDFPFGAGDVVPVGQRGKHVTTILVDPERMERCHRDEALPEGTNLAPHQLSPNYDSDQLAVALEGFRERLDAIGVEIRA